MPNFCTQCGSPIGVLQPAPDAMREALVYTVELCIEQKYQWCIIKVLPRVETVIENFGAGPDAYKAAEERLPAIKDALSAPVLLPDGAAKRTAPESCPHCFNEDDCSNIDICNVVQSSASPPDDVQSAREMLLWASGVAAKGAKQCSDGDSEWHKGFRYAAENTALDISADLERAADALSAPVVGVTREAIARPLCPLQWEENVVDRGDGANECYGFEADSGFGSWYVIERYFGSDSYGWTVEFDLQKLGDVDDPNHAKDIAQADFQRRIAAILALSPVPDATVSKP